MPVESTRGDPALARLIGARIRHAREASRLSQAELAAALDLSQAAMSTIENGTRPLRVEELVVISRVIGRDLEYFLEPAQIKTGPVGVTLRAEVVALQIPEYQAAVSAFLDEVERLPLPEPAATVSATDPEEGARQATDAAGESGLPIDVHAIARQLGVAVFARPFPDALSGFFVRHGNGGVIGVNATNSLVRRRFSVAHELGHFVLPHGAEHFVSYGTPVSEGDPPNYDWRKEREANQFAAELLMPAEQVRSLAGSLSISRLAKRFDVSQAAMAYRLASLKLEAG